LCPPCVLIAANTINIGGPGGRRGRRGHFKPGGARKAADALSTQI
jgi:hypothetical protein